MIEAQHLTKRYGQTVAVDEASFAVRPGRVTGFLGPNGAGKSTTMRMILGLDTLSRRGAAVERCPDGAMIVTGLDSAAIGGAASAHDITLLELAVHGASLEEAFFELTRDETDYHAGQLATASKGI